MKSTIKKWNIYTLGDHAIVFALAPIVDTKIVQEINTLSQFINQKKIKGILDIIPSYHTLTIIYDIANFLTSNSNSSNQIENFCENILNELDVQLTTTKTFNSNLIKVPVCYDHEFALDIENMSREKNISIADIIQIHSSKIYDVYSIGFLPGFAYMGTVDERIQMLRHAKPRMHVLAGSVGIAGIQTGIYPSNSPGGWQIIGRTPIKIFNPNPEILAKFKVGDQIQFYPISKIEFEKLNEYK